MFTLKKLLKYMLFGVVMMSYTNLLAGVRIGPNDADEISVSYRGKDVLVKCYDGESGKVKEKDGSFIFNSFKDLIRKKKKKARAGNTKAKKQMRNLRKLKKASDPGCEQISEPGGGGGEATPTPTPEGPQDSYFERSGDVTPLGTQTFEIPTGIQANAFTGQTTFNAYCTGCHEKRSRPTFTLLRQAVSQEPMYYTADYLSDEDLADITAYLNLHRSPATD